MLGKAELFYRDGTKKLVDLSEKRPEGLLENLSSITFFPPNNDQFYKPIVAMVAIPEGKTGRIFQRTTKMFNNPLSWLVSDYVEFAIGYDDQLTWIVPDPDD